MNQALSEIILANERESRGLDRSNVGGWHSDTDFFQWDADRVRTLMERVRKMSAGVTRGTTLVPDGPRRFNYRLDGWANPACYSPGDQGCI